MAEATAGHPTYQTVSMLADPLPGYSPPPATAQVPLITVDVENGQLVGTDVFTGQTMSEYTSLPVTNVRFTYHVTSTSASFSALGSYVIGNATFSVRALTTRDGKFSVTGTSPSPLPFRDIERQFYIPAPQGVYGETVGRVGLEDTVFQSPTLTVCTDDWGVQAGLQISGTVDLPSLAGVPTYIDVVVRLTDGRYHLSTGVIVESQSLQGLVHTVTGQDIPFLSAIATPGFGVSVCYHVCMLRVTSYFQHIPTGITKQTRLNVCTDLNAMTYSTSPYENEATYLGPGCPILHRLVCHLPTTRPIFWGLHA
ncbi:uncharacterized protein LOC118429924 [Branchiostoma floridae]|uniref:Uncharacterized protein LOC118429924 n=1 Tax=Branchiostoma floridae TaxID=7739 RepID=A0A9J7M825_BRAFL|nr:uncharacterized protein LOC118429924 [Branchiostoma floridae]